MSNRNYSIQLRHGDIHFNYVIELIDIIVN